MSYDTDSSLQVDVWSPELYCDESGWQSGGHSNELMWSWTNTDYRIGITSPHFQTRQSNHLSVTQPLLADLELDGQPELVLTVVDSTTDDPHIISLPLGASAPTVNWDVTLDRGTHPSDPAWAQLDAQTSVVVAQPSTKTQETCGFGELTEARGQTIGVVLHYRAQMQIRMRHDFDYLVQLLFNSMEMLRQR